MRKVFLEATVALSFSRPLSPDDLKAIEDEMTLSMVCRRAADVQDVAVARVTQAAADCVHAVAQVILLIDENAFLLAVMNRITCTVDVPGVGECSAKILDWMVTDSK